MGLLLPLSIPLHEVAAAMVTGGGGGRPWAGGGAVQRAALGRLHARGPHPWQLCQPRPRLTGAGRAGASGRHAAT
jgi:hypothetical protein